MHGKGDGKKRKRWEERCALDQGQRESPLERLQSKSLIYKYASPSFLTPLSLLSIAPFPRSKTRIPPCIFSRSLSLSLQLNAWIRRRDFVSIQENLIRKNVLLLILLHIMDIGKRYLNSRVWQAGISKENL